MPGREQTDVVLGEDAPLLEVMSTMRAMRRLAPDPVPDELLDRLVEAATWAPSGGNIQQYHYVVVTDRGQMERLADIWRAVSGFYLATFASSPPQGMDAGAYERLKDALRYQADHFHETPAVIVCCYDSSGRRQVVKAGAGSFPGALARLGAKRSALLLKNSRRAGEAAEAGSVYPGVQNLLLTARALGLAATLTTWHLFLEDEVKDVLGIPGSVNTFAIVPVGWPLGRMGPVKRRPPGDVIHRDRW